VTTPQEAPYSLLEHDLRYLAMGLPIFPVCGLVPHTHLDEEGRLVACLDPGKVPLVRWKPYQDRLPSEGEIFRWRRRWPDHNIGMATGHLSRIVVMDLDGELAIRVAQARGYANGPHVFTGRVGGLHRYFGYQEDAPRNFTKRDGIDFRGEGGYVILPPSRHALGREYRWGEELDDVEDLPALPEWMLDLSPPRRERAPSDSSEVIAEGARNSRLTSIAGALRHHGADEEAILGALLGINARQCRPPLADGEVHQIASSVARYAPEPDDSPRIRLQPEPQAAATHAPPRWWTSTSIQDIVDEEVTWFAYGLVARGLATELDGKVKRSGKTTLVLSMCRAILLGEEFLGQPTEYTPIVYLTEQSGTSFKRNLRDAGLLGRDDLHILLWSDVAKRDWPTVAQDAALKVRETGAGLLVVDTLGQFSRVRGDDENKSGAALRVMEPLLEIQAAGTGVLINRHDRKSGGEVGDSGRGSSAYAGAVDVVLHLQRTDDAKPGTERQRVLEGLSRFEETPEKLLIELTSKQPYTYTALGDVADERDRRLRIDILSCLPTNPEDAVREKELQEMAEARAVDFRRVLRRLLNEGEVIRIGPGKPGHPHLYYQRVWNTEI